MQIQSNLSDLRSEHSRLLAVWEAKKTKIDQRLEYQSLLQDVDSLEATCAAHEVSACTHEYSIVIFLSFVGSATNW